MYKNCHRQFLGVKLVLKMCLGPVFAALLYVSQFRTSVSKQKIADIFIYFATFMKLSYFLHRFPGSSSLNEL